MRKLVLALALAVLPLPGQLGRTGPPSGANPLARDSAAVEAGRQRFEQLCTGCHGRTGEGGQGEGQGPNLVNSWEVRRANDRELMNYIHDGVKGTAMPAFPLAPDQVRQLAAFVRSLNAPASGVPVPGDPAAGETLFYGKGGCGGCHMIRGRGGYLGPDLSNLGVSRRMAEIRNAIIQPAMLSTAGYQPVLLPGGVRGIVKHESNWSFEILDEKGEIHAVRGAAMKTLTLKQGSWMPGDLARRLSATDIDNLVAYLSRQVVRPDSGEPDLRRRPQEQPN